VTGQSDAAAERSYHEPAAAAASAGPVVEVAPGVFKLRVVADLEAEVARLKAALLEAGAALDKAAADLARLEVENRALSAWVAQQT
jgi:PPE-repeat protein